MGPLWKEMPISRAFLYISLRTPSRGALPSRSPQRASIERHSISRALFHLYIRVPGKWAPSRFSIGPLQRDVPVSRAFFYIPSRVPSRQGLQIKHNLTFFSKSLVQEPPSMFPQWGLYGERCSISRAIGLFIHSYLSESSLKEFSHIIGVNIQSPSPVPHADRRRNYSAVRPGSSRGSFMTLL